MAIVKVIGAVFFLNILDYVLAPVTTILVVKNLSIAEFGFYSWIGTLIGLVSTLFTLGLGQYNYINIPGRPESEQYGVLGRSLLIEIVLTAIGAFVVMVWMRDDLVRYGILALVLARLILVVVNSELIRFLGFQKKNVLKSLVAVLDARVWFFPLVVFAALKMVTLPTILMSLLLGNLLTLCILLFVLNRQFLVSNIRYDFDFAKTALKVSIPLVLIDLGMYLQELGARYILKIYTSYESIGLFSFAYSWFALIFKFGVLFIYTFQPYFSESYYRWKSGTQSALPLFKEQIKVGFRVSIVFIGAVLISFTINYSDFIVLVGKASYAETVSVALALAPYPLFMFMAYFLQILIILKKKTGRMQIFYGIAAAVNIGLNFLLIPALGYVGAGLVCSVSYLVLSILLYTQTREEEFRLRFSLKELALLATFFLSVIGINFCAVVMIHSFWLRLVVLIPAIAGCLLIVVRRRDLVALRAF